MVVQDQYIRHRREYHDKYKKYSLLYDKLQQNQREFAQYQTERKLLESRYGAASAEVKQINDKILALHEARKHDVAQWEKEFQLLHQTLGDIKRLVKDYERAHAES